MFFQVTVWAYPCLPHITNLPSCIMYSWNRQIRTWDNAAMKESGHAAASKPPSETSYYLDAWCFFVCASARARVHLWSHCAQQQRVDAHREGDKGWPSVNHFPLWTDLWKSIMFGNCSYERRRQRRIGNKREKKDRRPSLRYKGGKEQRRLSVWRRKKREDAEMLFIERGGQGPGRLGRRGGSAIGAHLKTLKPRLVVFKIRWGPSDSVCVQCIDMKYCVAVCSMFYHMKDQKNDLKSTELVVYSISVCVCCTVFTCWVGCAVVLMYDRKAKEYRKNTK